MEAWVNKKIGDISKDKPVALAMQRTPLLMVTLFALLKRGITFLPVDPSFPTERLQYMLKKAEIDTILSDCERNICEYKTLFLENEDTAYEAFDGLQLSCGQENEVNNDVAYILFTSGTTGNPKAVEVFRSGLSNFIEGIMEAVTFEQETRIICITNATFDIFFLESILALKMGMMVVLADEEERKNPRLVKRLIENNDVNTIQCTPSTIRMLAMVDSEYSFLKGVKTLMIGGEPFPPTLLQTLQKVMRGRIYNMYGPTETTIWSTVGNLTTAASVNIGKPIKATEVFIVDANLNRLETGEEGEILIAGKGLAKGYLKDEERTTESFVTIQGETELIRAYRTGDYGYLDRDGNFVCTGRRDSQVKILGHRIELGDVEYNISRINRVENNVVVVDPDTGNRLICFFIGSVKIDEKKLRYETLKFLPEYMVPSVWICVDELIYTASGKIDRKAMWLHYSEKVKEEQDGLASIISEGHDDIVAKILECFSIAEGVLNEDTELKSLGLDSIEYVSCLIDIEEVFDIEFMDEMLSADYFGTIKDMANYIQSVVE